MKIEKIILKNFRCFGPEPTKIDLEAGVTALVGGNGAGKTAMLLALARLFGVTPSQRSVRLRDFHLPPDQHELPDGSTLYLECILGFPELAGGGAGGDAVPDLFEHMAASAPGAPLKARLRLKATWTNDGTPAGSIQEDIRWITTLGDEFEWDSCHRVSAIDRAAIQLVYVPAARNASERVTELLKGRLWQAARWSDRLKRTAGRGAMLIQKRFEQEDPASFVIDRLSRRWQQLNEADTDTTPMLRLVESRLEDLVRRAEFGFFPDEAGRVREVEDLSDGQCSLFHIALTAATLETERDVLALPPADAPFEQEKLRRAHLTVLAIEEPENSLSPFFLSRIMTQAREIGTLPSAQVVLSSHSASILGRVEPEEIRYFRLDRPQRRAVVRPLTLPADDADAAWLIDVSGHDSHHGLSRRDRAGTIRSSQDHAVFGPIPAHVALYAHHVLGRYAVGDTDTIANARIGGFHDGIGRERRWHHDDGGIGTGGRDRIFHRIEHRHPVLGLTAFSRRDAGNDVGAILDHFLRVETADGSGNALDQNFGVFVDQNAHEATFWIEGLDWVWLAVTARWAASASVEA